MSTSDDESESKSMMKMAKSKKKVNNSDITPKEQDSEVAVRDLQIDIPSENAIVEYVETDKDGRHNENVHVETSMDTEDRTVSKDTTTSIPEETDAEDSSPEIVTDVHVDASVMEDSEIHDEPPKKILKQLIRGPSLQPKDQLRRRPNLMNPHRDVTSFIIPNKIQNTKGGNITNTSDLG